VYLSGRSYRKSPHVSHLQEDVVFLKSLRFNLQCPFFNSIHAIILFNGTEVKSIYKNYKRVIGVTLLIYFKLI
jgi:hypothetical protein